MNNEVFNLNDALSINELEERQELSIAAGFEVDDKPGTTTINRCNNNDIGLNTPDGSGNGESNRFYFEP